MSSPPLRLACLVMKYPALTQTFIERDLLGLVAQGIEVEVHPIWDFRRPDQIAQINPAALRVVRAPGIGRLVQGAAQEAWRIARQEPALARRAFDVLATHWPRHGEGWFMTLWGTFFGLARAEEFRRNGVAVVHGAWATAPATAAAVLGARGGIPYSIGAHAYDLHRHGGDPLLRWKMQTARFVHTTTDTNATDLRRRFPERKATVVLARRGLTELPPVVPRAQHAGPVRLLSVGRLVEKKGHSHQIAAGRELARRGVDFRLKIIGEGPSKSALQTQIARAGLTYQVELAGAQSAPEVAAAYAKADIFWHTGIVDAQGDRDGLPNVIPEAMAHGLPVISSAAGGAGEAVREGGLIVDPADPVALADAVQRLANDPALREQMGKAGRDWVTENFLAENNTRLLAEAFFQAAGKQKAEQSFGRNDGI